MVCHLLLVCHYLKIVEPRKIHSPSFFFIKRRVDRSSCNKPTSYSSMQKYLMFDFLAQL
jgi:hypothetical protein